MLTSKIDLIDMSKDDGCREGDASMFDLISSFLGPSSLPRTGRVMYELTEDSHQCHEDKGRGESSTQTAETSIEHKIIIFSKDRPWQLQQLLRSMHLNKTIRNNNIHVYVICRVTISFKSGYDEVKDTVDLNPLRTTWLYECGSPGDKEASFAHILEKVVLNHHDAGPESETSSVTNPKNIVMFLTDDCILLEPIDNIFDAAESVLNTQSRVLGLLTRLHPGITFCQTKNEACPPPRSHFSFIDTNSKLKVFTYPYHYGSSDFAYPFDLSGGIYHQSTCIEILHDLQRFHQSKNCEDSRTLGYSHPNTLEIEGNKALARMRENYKGQETKGVVHKIQMKDLLAIPSKKTLLILAINRVQNIFQAPLATGITGTISYSPELLISFLDKGEQLDLEKYKHIASNSSHIGDVFLQQIESHSSIVPNEAPFALSVLIPIHTGPPSAAGLAMKSILHETQEDVCVLPIQIVLVDDRCIDGSIDQMLETAQIFAEENHQAIDIWDHRICGEGVHQSTSSSIMVEVTSCPSPGIAAALNFGIEICQSNFVARMDADDVMCPHRLATQLQYLKNNPSVDALGTNCIIFSDVISSGSDRPLISIPFAHHVSACKPQYNLLRSSIEPTDPGFVAWSMLFSCVIVHPSVMFQKSKIISVGGYIQTGNVICTEDYDLWLRLIQNNPRSVCSVPIIGVFHRKHSNRSANDKRAIRQRQESTQLSSLAMARYCGTKVPLSSKMVEVLKQPKDADELCHLNDAASLLCTLETGFVMNLGVSLTKNEINLIALDCNARLGELATLSLERFGLEATNGKAWNLWCERCPDLQMERLALLLHAKNSKK